MNGLFDFDLLTITEKSAIEASKWMGKGDPRQAFISAHDVLYKELEKLPIKGRVVLSTCHTYPDFCVGAYKHGEYLNPDKKDVPEFEFAISPLECVNSVAFGRWNAVSTIAVAAPGTFMTLNEKLYMEKLIVGAEAKGKIDINDSVMSNLNAIAMAKNKRTKDLVVAILDRPRNNEIINQVRACGARIVLLLDGDLEGGIATNDEHSDIDVLMGSGGAIEGIITAAVVKVMGGDMQAKFIMHPNYGKIPTELSQFRGKRLTLDNMVRSELMKVVVTGITDGNILHGIDIKNNRARVHSMVINSEKGVVRFIMSYKKVDE